MGRAESVAAELQNLGALGAPQFGRNGKIPTPTTPLPDEDRQLLRELAAHARQQIQLVRSSITALTSHVDRLEVMVQGMEEIAALGDEPTEESAPKPADPAAETESGEAPSAPDEADDLEEEPQEEQPDGNLQEAS